MILRELPRFIRLRMLPLDPALEDRKELSTELCAEASDILAVDDVAMMDEDEKR